jgi:hypothetical protein
MMMLKMARISLSLPAPSVDATIASFHTAPFTAPAAHHTPLALILSII